MTRTQFGTDCPIKEIQWSKYRFPKNKVKLTKLKKYVIVQMGW